MTITTMRPFPRFHRLPAMLSVENAARIELEEGIPVLRASTAVQARIEMLLYKQRTSGLSAEEEEELDRYEDIDDYLSFLNRVVRNLLWAQNEEGA